MPHRNLLSSLKSSRSNAICRRRARGSGRAETSLAGLGLDFWRGVGLVFFVLGVCRFVPAGTTLAMVGSVVSSFLGPKRAIQALMTCLLLLNLSPAWKMSSLGIASEARWIVLLGAALSAARIWTSGRGGRAGGLKVFLIFVLAFCLFEVAVSSMISSYPTITVFKLCSFGIGAASIPLCFALSREKLSFWQDWFGGWFAGCLVAGVLCLAWGGGFTRNGQGFEGAFGHPNVLGVIMGVGAAFFFGRFFLSIRNSEIEGLLGLACLIAVYFSQARTGLLGVGLSASIAGVLLFVRHGTRLAGTRAFRHVWVGVLVLLAVTILLPGQLSLLMAEFVAKGEAFEDASEVSIGEAFSHSRSELVDQSMENFRENPVLGIGFGAPSFEYAGIKEIGGIPISATTEKGFLPTAILEEIGIIGALWFVTLLFVIVATQLRNGNPLLLWPMLAGIVMNLGEAMFFSIGGLGLFVWMLIGLAFAGAGPRRGSKRRRRNSRAIFESRKESSVETP